MQRGMQVRGRRAAWGGVDGAGAVGSGSDSVVREALLRRHVRPAVILAYGARRTSHT